ncbi:MAG: hypothetical protein AB1567_07885 [bacterium]
MQIIGAVAVGIYGLPRTTYDIDVIVNIEKIKFIPFFLNISYIKDCLKRLIGTRHSSFKTFQQIFEKT